MLVGPLAAKLRHLTTHVRHRAAVAHIRANLRLQRQRTALLKANPNATTLLHSGEDLQEEEEGPLEDDRRELLRQHALCKRQDKKVDFRIANAEGSIRQYRTDVKTLADKIR